MISNPSAPTKGIEPISWLDAFLAGMTPSDWVNTGLLAVGVATLIWTARSLSLQSRAHDFSGYLLLTERFSTAWRRFKDAREDERAYEFHEVLNLIEGACQLHNRGALHGTTRDMIGAYLKEVIDAIYKDEFAKGIMETSLSGPDTYFGIRRFARKQGIDGVPHQ